MPQQSALAGSSPAPPSRPRTLGLTIAIAVQILLIAAALAHADSFAELDGPAFFALPRRQDAHLHHSLSTAALEALPEVMPGQHSAFILVQTDQGALAKLLVTAGFRKPAVSAKSGALIPVLNLDKFATIDAGDRQSITAGGSDVMLFHGFQLDLDTGHIVPPGMGGDIEFATGGPDGPRLAAVGDCRLITFEKPVPARAVAGQSGRPSVGRLIQPTDYAGRYRLIANGQWSGTLELAVEAGEAVSGRFRSDRNGSVYPVTGKIDPEPKSRIEFEIQFPQARQSYEGTLWTEAKNAFAGTLAMAGRSYSFIAIREGSALRDRAIDIGLMGSATGKAGEHVVVVDPGMDRNSLDGKTLSNVDLESAIARLVKEDPKASILVRAPGTSTIDQVIRTIRLIEKSGAKAVRLAPVEDGGGID